MAAGRSILVLLAVTALVVGAAGLYWSVDPPGTGVAAAATHPGHQPIPEIISNITAGDGASLSGVRGLDAFAADGGLYVVAAASYDDAILVINVTDPHSPRVISSVADDGATALGGASAVDIIRIGSGTYAVVAASDDGLQIINLTRPADPTPVASLTDDSTVALDGAYDVDTFLAGSGTYAVVASASDDGLQIINLTDPADPTPVSSLTDDSTVALDGAVAVDTIRIGSGIYAVSVSPNDDGLQIINLTDPADPTPVSSLTDDTSVHLGGARGVAALNLGSGTYAVVASNDGLQVVEITDPADPTPVARVPDGVHAALGDASAAAASNDDGLQAVEITDPADPADPVPVAQVPNGVHAALGDASAVDTFTMNGGTYAVVATADGIVVVDLADPAGPVPVYTAYNNTALYGASAVKAFHMAGHVYVAVAVPDGGGAIRIASLGEMDSIPPTISSATWLPANHTITLVFSEPLDHAATDYTGIDILGESANLTLADISSRTAAGHTIAATLSPAQEATLGVPGMVRLYEGAVRDVSANPIYTTELAVTLPDSVPPAISSAAYAPGTGLLAITFSEPLNHTATIYPDIAVAGPVHGDAMRISVLLAFMYPDIAVTGPIHLYTLDEISVGTASDMTIEATLDAAQIEAVGSAPMLYMMEGAVRDMSGNPIGAVRGLGVAVLADASDITPPVLASSHYNTGTGVLNITFSEPLNGTIHYDRMHIRDIGRSIGGLALDDIASRILDANSTATLTLSDTQRQMISDMTTPQLDIGADAVFDIAGNGISAAPDQPITIIDGIPPTIVSAAYVPGTGILSITFSEPLGTNIDYSGLVLAGENGNVALDDVSTKSHSDDTITATLNAAQRTAVGDATTVTVSEGAVADIAGNGIAQTTIPVDMADGIPPTLISSSYNTGTGILSIAFSEPLGPAIHYDRMHIRDTGRSTGGLALDDIASRILDANITMTLTLSDIQRQTVNAMNQPELDIEAGAVFDIAGNGISATPDQPITVTDGIPPTIVSVDYNTGSGILSITFSEPLDPAIDYSGVSVTGTGGSVALDDTASGHSGATITAALDAAQRDTAGISPTLSISAGAVSDIYGNPIRQVSNFQIAVEVAPVLTVPDDPPRDTAPPRLLSSYYTTGTGALNMTFNEPLRSPIDYTGIILVGPSQNVTLDTVTARNHTGSVINATLDVPQRAIVGERPGLSISAGAVSDRSGNRIQHTDGTILVIDGAPPEFVSSYYNTGTGALNVTFNEPLADIRYDLMHIRDDGQAAGGISLNDVTTRTVAPSATMTLMLSDAQRLQVNGMTAPQLDIDAGAVSDIGRNQIAATPNQPITIIDGIAPTVDSVAYTTGRGALVVVFSEPLNETTVDYSGVSVVGPTGSVVLDDVATKEVSGDRITATLDADQRATAGDAPTLSVSAGAVSDVAGNPILAATPAVTTIDGIPPTVISSSYNTGSGLLSIKFSESLDSTIDYAGFALAGPSQSVTLDAVTSKNHTGGTITAALDADQRDTAGDAPTLSVSAGAVADLHGNLVDAASPALTVIDGIPPTLASSHYNTGTGALNMTFSEPLGSTIHYGSIAVRDAGESTGGLSLGDVTTRTVDSSTTITLTLSATQRTTVNGMATPQLDIGADAVADIAGNGIEAAPDQSITVIDGIPPTISSAAYNTGTGILNMTFSEPLGTTIDYSGIELTGENGTVALDVVSTKTHSNDTITATLNAAQRTTVGDTMTLSVSEGAVADLTGNGISAAPDLPVTIIDGTPPLMVSSSYNIDTGILNITFNEPLDPAATDYSGLAVSGQLGNVTLDQVATKTTDVSTIWAILNATQMETAGAAPTLAIGEGAVYDPAGNGIVQTTGTIEVTMLGPSIVEIRPVGRLVDTGTTVLGGTLDPGVFTAGSHIYAAVAAFGDNALQVVNITDPADPRSLGHLSDTGSTALNQAWAVVPFESGGRTYAVVTSYGEHGIQVVNLTDPASPTAAGRLTDTTNTALNNAQKVETFESGGRTYAVVASNGEHGIQVVDLTDPANPAAAGRLTDTSSTILRDAYSVAVFESGGRTYAVVASNGESGIQVVDLTDPASPAAAGRLTGTLYRQAFAVDTIKIGGFTYGVVGTNSGIVAMVDLTDPDNPRPTGSVGVSGDAFDLTAFESGGYHYALVGPGYGETHLDLVDVSDPANPVLSDTLHDNSTTALAAAGKSALFSAGDILYAIVGSYQSNGIQTLHIITEADVPPNLAAATYHTFDRDLAMTFDRRMNGTATDLSLLGVRDAGGDVPVSLANSTVAAVDRTVTVTLDVSTAASVSAMTEPTLVMGEGAVTGIYGNLIAAGNHTITILDVFPPTVSSASYYNGTGLLSIEFDEPLNHAATDYSGLAIVGQRGNVTLDHIASKTAASSTISVSLNAAQMGTVGTAATLAVSEGAVYDPAGNGIAGTTETIEVAMLGPPIFGIRPVAAIASDANIRLYDATYLALFEIGGNTYAIVTADYGVRIIDLTDPASPTAVSSVTDGVGGFDELAGAEGVDTFTIAGRTYAAVTAAWPDNGVQIIDLTDPASPTAVSSVTDGVGGFDELRGARAVDTFTIGNSIYAAVAAGSDDGVQIIDLTDPASPSPIAAITDGVGGFTELDGAVGVGTFTIAGRTYAAVAAATDDGVQIIDLTNPASPSPIANITDGSDYPVLDGAIDVDIFTTAGRTYAAVTAQSDSGVQIIDLTNPASPSPTANLADTDLTELGSAADTDIFTTAGRTYAAVASYWDDGVQIIDLTDPASPSPTANLADTDLTELNGAHAVDTFTIGNSTYAAVTAQQDSGVQILHLMTEAEFPLTFASATYNLTSSTLSITFSKDINGAATDYSLLHVRDFNRADGGVTLAGSTSKTTADRTLTVILDEATAMTVNAMVEPRLDIDPGAVTDTYGNQIEEAHDQSIDTIWPFAIYPISSLADGALDTPLNVAHFGVDGRHYALVTARDYNTDKSGIHIVNVTDPYRPYPVVALYDSAALPLSSVSRPDTFQVDGRTYAAVTVTNTTDSGRYIQIMDLTDPAAPVPISQSVHPSGGDSRLSNLHIYRSGGDTYLMAAGQHYYSIHYHPWALNVTDPANPTQLGTVEAFHGRHNSIVGGPPFETGGHTYWLMVKSRGAYTDQLYVVNATDPTDLRYVAANFESRPSTGYSLDVFEAGGLPYALVISDDEGYWRDNVYVLNLTDPTYITTTDRSRGVVPSGGIGVFELDGRTYALAAVLQDIYNNVPSKVVVYDVSNPANVRLAGSLNDTAHTLLTRVATDTFLGPDGRTYALAADRDEGGLQILRFDTDGMDDEPPIFLDASYRYDGLLTINFHEPLNSINYSRMHIRDAGQDAGGVSLDGSANRAVSGGTITMTINQSSRDDIEAMGLPQLDIGRGAVADMAGNPVRDLDDQPLSLIRFVISQLSETDLGGTLRAYESNGHNYVAGFTVFSSGNWRIHIHNVSDPAAPASVGDAGSGSVSGSTPFWRGLDYYVRDGRSYLAAATDRLAVYDVTDPSSATETDTLSYNRHFPNDVSIYGLAGKHYAVLPSGYETNRSPDGVVRIANLTDPGNLMPEGDITRLYNTKYLRYPVTADTFVVGDSTYAAIGSRYAGDMQILNVTDPDNPTLAGILYFSPDYGTECFDVETLTIGGGPWVAALTCPGLDLVDVSDPDEPALAASTSVGPRRLSGDSGQISTLQADGRTYLVTGSAYGLQVFDASDPFRMELVASLSLAGSGPLAGSGLGVFETGGSAYAAVTRGILELVPYLPNDKAPPTVTGAVYNPDSDTIRMNFSEPVAFPVNSALLHVRDENQNSGGVTLSGSPPVKGSFTTFQLDATQAAGLDAMNSTQLDVDAGAVSDLAGNQIQSAADIPVAIEDPIPPRLVQATYTVLTRTLNVTFHEHINGTVNAGLLNVRETGDLPNIEVPLSETTLDRVAGHSAYFVLDAHQAATLEGMDAPQLDVDAGAVFDVFDNPVHAVADWDITIIDSVPPTLVFSYYNTGGFLALEFSEPLNRTATDYSGLTVRGQLGNVTLDQAATKGAAVSTIWASLNATQMETAGTAPTLAISDGAVSDLAGNGIVQTTETIEVTMLGPLIAEIKPEAAIDNGDANTKLNGAIDLDLFEIGSKTYAIVSTYSDHGIQIINLTDPASPSPIASFTTFDTNIITELLNARGVDTFTIGNRTYAAVAAYSDDGVQIINLTDPASPSPIGRLADNRSTVVLDGAWGVDTFTIGNRTYAAVTASEERGIQIIDLTDPTSPSPTASLSTYLLDGARDVDTFTIAGRTYAAVTTDSRFRDGVGIIDLTYPTSPSITGLRYITSLDGARGVDTFTIAGRTYAAVAATTDDGVQIIDLTDPTSPSPIANLTDTTLTELDGATGVDTFTIGNRTYAAVAATTDDGVQIIDLTNPARPSPIANLTDTTLTELDGATGVDTFTIGNRTYAAVAAATDDGVQILQLLTGALPVQGDALMPHSASYQPGGQSDPNSGIPPRPPLGDVGAQSDDQHKSRSVSGQGGNVHQRDGPANQAGSQGGQVAIAFSGQINGTILPERLHIRNASSFEPAFALSGQPEITNGNTTTFTLDPDRDAILQNMTSPLLDIEEGAVYDTDGNPIPDIRGHPIDIPDMTPPTLDSAVYHIETNQLDITFSEPLNHTATDHALLELLGPSANVTLAQVGEPAAAVNGTISVTLNATHLETLGGTPSAISAGQAAVYDTAGNPIQPATIPVGLSDMAPPEMDSATYHTETGRLAVTFTEPLNHTATDHTLLELLGPSSNLTLAHIEMTSSNQTISTHLNGTISTHLNATHLEALGGIPSAVSAEEAAVYDTAGNPIRPATIPVSVLGPDYTPPTVSSATYDISGRLTVQFSEPINHTSVVYGYLAVLGSSGNLTLADIPASGHTAPANHTIAAALNATHQQAVGEPATLVVSDDALRDVASNPIQAARHPIIPVNSPPVADAGPDQTVRPGHTATLNGTASYDPDADAISYLWSQEDGPTVILSNHTSPTPTFTAPDGPAILAFRLNVTDGASSSSDATAVSVTDISGRLLATPINLRANSTVYSVTLAWDYPGNDTVTGYKILSRIPATQPNLHTIIHDTGTSATTHTIPNLEPATAYTFRVVAMNDDGQSNPSRFVSISTKDPPPPAIPINLRATSTASSVTLTWDDPDDTTITGYKILSRERDTQNTLTVLVADTGSAGTTHTIPNLEPDTAYVFRIIALGHGESPRSASVAISTTGSPSDPAGISHSGPLSPPTNLQAISTVSSVTLKWDDPNGDTVTGYKILSRIPATQQNLHTIIHDTGTSTTTHTIPNLEPATAYTFRIVAMSDDGQSQPSHFVSISTKDPPPPAIPTNLQATSTTSSVILTWDDPDDTTITGYKILSRERDTQTTLSVLVADTGSADTSYTIPNLEPATAYVFRIIALGHGESPRSASVAISTTGSPSDPAGISPRNPLSPPTNLKATSTTSSVTLKWDDPKDPTITGYEILSRIPATQPKLSTLVGDTGTPATKYTITDLEPATAYTFRVVALSDDGQSQPSRFVAISTKDPSPPAIPTNLQATSTASSVTLTWDDPDDDTITGYEILSRERDTQPKLSTLVGDTGTPATTRTIPNLEPGTAYVFRIIALSDYGESKFSDPVTVSTLPDRPPAITLAGQADMAIQVGSAYAEPGYTATDDHDGDITGSVVVTGTVDASTTGTYTIRYDVTDSSGNPAVQQVRTVRVADETPPVITLSGSTSMSIPFGTTYAEPGYTATDNYDGDITGSVSVSGTVDAAVPGTYTIRYDAADSSGNAAETRTRTVTVGPIPISNSTAPVPPTNSTAPVPPTNSTVPNSAAVDGQSMTPSDTRGIRGPAPDGIQAGAIRVGWETLDKAPRDYRVSWAKTVEPFPT